MGETISEMMERAGRAFLEGFLEGIERGKEATEKIFNYVKWLNETEDGRMTMLRFEKKERHRRRYFRMMERMKNGRTNNKGS